MKLISKKKKIFLNKQIVNDQFKYFKNIFVKDNNLENIYSNNKILYYPRILNIYKKIII